MNRCSVCHRDYLDVYDVCPFCARESAATPLDVRRGFRRAGVPHAVAVTLGAIGSLAGIIVYVVLQGFFGALGTETMHLADTNACHANQAMVERAALVRYVEAGRPAHDMSGLVPQYIEMPACPGEGEYVYEWSENGALVWCTEHGWRGDRVASR